MYYFNLNYMITLGICPKYFIFSLKNIEYILDILS